MKCFRLALVRCSSALAAPSSETSGASSGKFDTYMLQKMAEEGDAEAQYVLANCYYNGDGVEQDKSEAVKWYRKAAEQGHAKAQYNLGVCYANGDGVEQDNAEAANWLRRAAEQGFEPAINVVKHLGNI